MNVTNRPWTPAILRGIALLACTGLWGVGCARFTSAQGVDNTWRASSTPTFTVGTSTQADVLEALGPPSQIITMNRGMAFYYLREYGEGNVLFLLVYNTSQREVNYDRAVFFFDETGLMTDYSFSREQAPRT